MREPGLPAPPPKRLHNLAPRPARPKSQIGPGGHADDEALDAGPSSAVASPQPRDLRSKHLVVGCPQLSRQTPDWKGRLRDWIRWPRLTHSIALSRP